MQKQSLIEIAEGAGLGLIPGDTVTVMRGGKAAATFRAEAESVRVKLVTLEAA